MGQSAKVFLLISFEGIACGLDVTTYVCRLFVPVTHLSGPAIIISSALVIRCRYHIALSVTLL